MRLALAIMMLLAVAMAVAVEDSNDMMVKICGDDMAKALQEACEHKNVDYLIRHGLYEPEDELIQTQHRDHEHDHEHGHEHNHDHRHNHKDNHSNAETNENDRSILQECCHKPCFVKDFISYCG